MTGVGFSSTSLPLSWLIRELDGVPFSHCWIYDDREGVPMVLEAGFGGVIETPYHAWAQGKTNIQIKRIASMDISRAVDAAKLWIGESYDFEGLLGELWVLAGRWLSKKWHNPIQDAHALFCAEMVAAVLKLAAYPKTMLLAPCDCDPRCVWELLQQEPLFELPQVVA